MADIVDVSNGVNCATGMQLKKAFEAIVKANPAINIDTNNIRNAGVPFRGRATGSQLYDAFAAVNVVYPDTVDLRTIQNRMDGNQLKAAFTAINAAMSGGASSGTGGSSGGVAPLTITPGGLVPTVEGTHGYNDLVVAGKPGHFDIHIAANLPANLTALRNMAIQGSTPWAPGEYVVLGDGSKAHWIGDHWAAGAAVVNEEHYLTKYVIDVANTMYQPFPVGATPPANFAELLILGALGQTTAWAEGYVIYMHAETAHWDGSQWQTGVAPAAPHVVHATGIGTLAGHEYPWTPAHAVGPAAIGAAPPLTGTAAWATGAFAFLADGTTKISWDGSAWAAGAAT